MNSLEELNEKISELSPNQLATLVDLINDAKELHKSEKTNGKITIDKKFTKWEWYSDINVKTLFLHMLLSANLEKSEWKGISVDVGAFISSYSKLSDETGLSPQQVRTAISKLKNTGDIEHEVGHKYGLFKITNFQFYIN